AGPAPGPHGVGYMLLYPVFDGQFELGWIGSETTVFVAPVLALVTIWVWVPRWRAARQTPSGVSPG
ncbi:MAG: hypothetical protein QGG40_11495, partial [Myxococcota bacterium]|nr:hypothetical protein [Myxococcota bacterium]